MSYGPRLSTSEKPFSVRRKVSLISDQISLPLLSVEQLKLKLLGVCEPFVTIHRLCLR